MSDNKLITNVVPGIARRLKSRRVKDESITRPPKTIKNKAMYGHPKAGRKVIPPSSKRKSRPVTSADDDEDAIKSSKSKNKVVLVKETDSEYDVEKDV